MLIVRLPDSPDDTDIAVEMIYDFETTKSRLILLRDMSWNPCSSYHAPSRILSAQIRNYFCAFYRVVFLNCTNVIECPHIDVIKIIMHIESNN